MLKIVTLPDKILRKKVETVKKPDKNLVKFVTELKQTLKKQKEPEGIGLAANQVGRDARIFVLKKKTGAIVEFINPEILEFSPETCEMTEGCLSVPRLYSKITRPTTVKVKYFNICVNQEENRMSTALKEIVEDYEGLEARVIQHEIDHLNGIVFIDHALKQGVPIYRLVKGKEGKDEFVEIKL